MLVMPYMAAQSQVNIGSGNGLLPDSIKPLPESMLGGGGAFIWEKFEVLKVLITKQICQLYVNDQCQISWGGGGGGALS